jgi:hypothetical protein
MAPRVLDPFANIFSNFDFKNDFIVKEFEGVWFRQTWTSVFQTSEEERSRSHPW